MNEDFCCSINLQCPASVKHQVIRGGSKIGL
jgi:hypothetical protein